MNDREKRRLEYLRYVKKIIDRDGFAIQGVIATKEDEIPFAYTIGLTAKNLPELLISGMPMDHMQSYLTQLRKIHFYQPLTHNRIAISDEGQRFLAIEAPLAQVGIAQTIYPPEKVSVLQLVWEGQTRGWPSETDTTRWQELFGLFEAPK